MFNVWKRYVDERRVFALECFRVFEPIKLTFTSEVFFFFWLFWLFRATFMAYGGSQARDQIGAVATATAISDLSCQVCQVFDLHHSSRQ